MARFLVTGAAGFIGSNIVEELLAQGHFVRALDNLCNGHSENLLFAQSQAGAGTYEFINADIRDADACRNACESIDYILHHAALGSVPASIDSPGLYHDNNVTGTLNMLIAARDMGVKRLVFASSTSVHGDTKVLPVAETTPTHPKSPYALTKLVCEDYCKLFAEVYGFETVIFRYFNVFGPKQDPNSQYAAAVPKFIDRYLHQSAPTIFGDGNQTRDFIYVKDVANANISACFSKNAVVGHPINIGSGISVTINELVDAIKVAFKSDLSPEYAPERAGDIRDSLADNEKAKTLLDLKPISLEKGLTETVQWYLNKQAV